MNQLFDKIISVELFTTNPPVGPAIDYIRCPDIGIKPNIGLSAHWITSNVIGNVELRLVNFYPSQPLNEYKWMRVTAGYAKGDQSTIEGMIFVAQNESPSPDGTTLFTLETGNAEGTLNVDIDMNCDPGTTLNGIFATMLNSLKASGEPWSINNSVPDQGTEGFNFQGKLYECLNELKDIWRFQYAIEGNVINIYLPSVGRSDIVDIVYFSSPPIADASGITFSSPWVPRLRPGMTIRIDPKYFRQTFEGKQIQYQKDGLMIAQMIDVNFNTVTNQNQMTVMALNTAEVVQR